MNFLYRNNGDRTFSRKSAAEVGPLVADRDLSWNCIWADVNNDGLLDLVVGNRASSPVSRPVPCRLYLNEGNGHFISVTGGDLGVLRMFTSPNLGDYDNDGWLDVFLATQWGYFGVRTNALLHGRGDGTFGIVTNCVIATDTLGDYLGQ